jgi:SAM-dependent methyltransferase
MLLSRRATAGGAAFTDNLYSKLASYYDDVHTGRRYATEVDAVLRIGSGSRRSPISRVLDLFCGTGGHSIPLAQRGLAVTGLDCSNEMLALARVKATQACLNIRFEHGDCRLIPYRAQFDLVSALGQSFHYLVDEADVDRTVRGIRAALRPGGVLILDLIDTPAMRKPWHAHYVDVRRDGSKVIRVMRSFPDGASRTTMTETLWSIEGSDGSVHQERTVETYRIFVLDDLAELLRGAGFAVAAIRRQGKGHDDHVVTLAARRTT